MRELTRKRTRNSPGGPVAWIDGGNAIIANRSRVDSKVGEVWRFEVADGGRRSCSAGRTRSIASDASADGRHAVTTNDRTGQDHAGVYDNASKSWRWLKPTVWEQTQGADPRGRVLLVRTNDNTRRPYRGSICRRARRRALPVPSRASALLIAPLSPDGRQVLIGRSAADAPANVYRLD